MIYERISDNIPPQIKILSMVIPILIRFYIFVSNLSVARRTKAYVIKQNVTQLMTSNYFPAIYCRKLLTLSNQTSRYKSKCIRIADI